MPLRSLDQLDDATFGTAGARVVAGQLTLHGWVVERLLKTGTVRLPVVLTVPNAIDVVIDSASGTGDLVLESFEVTATAVTLRGVIPCEVVVTTSARSEVRLDVGTEPGAVRRWGRWQPRDTRTR